MSRIGNKPVDIPDKVKVNIDNDGGVSVEGPKGKLNWKLPRQITGSVKDNHVSIARGAETRSVKALHGLSRALVHNMEEHTSELQSQSNLVCRLLLEKKKKKTKKKSTKQKIKTTHTPNPSD